MTQKQQPPKYIRVNGHVYRIAAMALEKLDIGSQWASSLGQTLAELNKKNQAGELNLKGSEVKQAINLAGKIHQLLSTLQ